jgi:hypothetical protein
LAHGPPEPAGARALRLQNGRHLRVQTLDKVNGRIRRATTQKSVQRHLRMDET